MYVYNCFKLLLLLDKTTLIKKNFVYICIFICLIFVAKHKKETKKNMAVECNFGKTK